MRRYPHANWQHPLPADGIIRYESAQVNAPSLWGLTGQPWGEESSVREIGTNGAHEANSNP
jgi:hypothetical protein